MANENQKQRDMFLQIAKDIPANTAAAVVKAINDGKFVSRLILTSTKIVFVRGLDDCSGTIYTIEQVEEIISNTPQRPTSGESIRTPSNSGMLSRVGFG